MKKLLSIVLAAIMTVSVFALSVLPVAATDSPTATVAVSNAPTLMVNGVITVTDIIYSEVGDQVKSVTFTYVGDGTLLGWEHNLEELGLLEGTDYTITYNEDGSMTINFISEAANKDWDDGKVTVNALVDFGDSNVTTTTVNDSSKSPSTGMSASAVAGAVAVACAGIAVLAATKKKDAE